MNRLPYQTKPQHYVSGSRHSTLRPHTPETHVMPDTHTRLRPGHNSGHQGPYLSDPELRDIAKQLQPDSHGGITLGKEGRRIYDLLRANSRNGNGSSQEGDGLGELVEAMAPTNPTVTTPSNQKNYGLGHGFRGLAASLALLTVAGCALKAKIEGLDSNLLSSRPDLQPVPIVYILGRVPQEVGLLTIPYYVVRPTKTLIDAHDYMDFTHQAYRVTCKENGLVQALEKAEIPNHYAQRMLRASCIEPSERDVHNALKKMTPEQREALAKALEAIIVNHIKDYSVNVKIEKGIAPEVRDGASLLADAMIWYVVIAAATDTWPFESGSKTKAPAPAATTCPPVCAPPQ